MEFQVDRDKTSVWAEQFMYFNRLREEKKAKQVALNHEATLKELQ